MCIYLLVYTCESGKKNVPWIRSSNTQTKLGCVSPNHLGKISGKRIERIWATIIEIHTFFVPHLDRCQNSIFQDSKYDLSKRQNAMQKIEFEHFESKPVRLSSIFIAKLSPWFGLVDGSVLRRHPRYIETNLSAWSWAYLQSVGLATF